MKPSITISEKNELIKDCLSIKQAMDFLGVTRQSIYNAIDKDWLCNGYVLYDDAREINKLLEMATGDQLNIITEYLDDLIN